MKKWIRTYLMSIRKDIVVLLIVDILFLHLMELVLRNIPAPYPIFVKIGNLMETLGVSFLASFIFYFVQVHLPETKEKNDLYPSIAILFHRIINTEKSLLSNYVGVRYSDLSEEKILAGAKARDVNKQDAPLILAGPERKANWMEYGFHEVSDIDRTWDKLMRLSNYQNSEGLSLLAKIQDDSLLGFFRTMMGIYPTLKHGLHIQGFEKDFVRFWHFVQGQQKYYDKVYSCYRIGEEES